MKYAILLCALVLVGCDEPSDNQLRQAFNNGVECAKAPPEWAECKWEVWQ